jgi:hypothetical protein
MRLVTGSLLALLMATPALAQQPPLGQPIQPEQREQLEQREPERQHVVRRGDTLWDLSGRYLANPFRWPLIHDANRGVVADPHWIYPEQVLVIPGVRDAVATYDPARSPAAPAPTRFTAADPAEVGRTVFYREAPVRTREGPTVLLEAAAARVPVKAGEFFRAEFLSTPAALPVVARVVRSARHGDSTGGLLPSAHPRDQVFLSYEAGYSPAIGDRLVVVEVRRQVPAAGPEVRIMEPRAVVRVLELEPEAIRVEVDQQFGRVISGHVVLPLDLYPDFLGLAAEPVAGEFDLTGTLMEMVEQQELYNVLSRGFINLGMAHGVQVGDIFEAYLPPGPARGAEATRAQSWGHTLPEQSLALLRVVRVMDSSATVVVDRIAQPHLAPGVPVRRVRKMP